MKLRIAAGLTSGLLLFFAGVLTGGGLFSGGAQPSLGTGASIPDDDPAEEQKIDRLRRELATLQEERSLQEQRIARLHRDLVLEEVAANVDGLSEEDSLATLSLKDLLQARAGIGDDDLGHSVILDQELRRRMVEAPQALEEVLARFEMAPDRHLAALIGSFAHPRTEQLAIDMAAPGRSREGRLLALEVLDRLDHLSPENHTLLLERLASEADPEILGAAIYALPHGVVKPELQSQTHEWLRSAAGHGNARVRASALLVLGMGPVDDSDVDVLLRHLADPAGEVRAMAIAAVRNYRGTKTHLVQEALRSRMNDSEESFAVRRQAWRNLSLFAMDEKTYRDWRALKHTLDGMADASGGAEG